jgi:hypothetical protein
MRQRSLICLALVALANVWVRGQVPEGWAVVTGQVLDSQGKPVTQASISLFPAAAFSGGLPYAATDQDGRYHLVSPPFGKAWLCAVKPTAGYPDTNSLLFAPEVDDRPEIFLAPHGVLTQDIHLAPPVGILEAQVIDAATRQIVPNGHIAMRRQKPHAIYSENIPKNGHFLYALPPARIEIFITAPGYRQWKYADKNGENALVLGNSEHRKLTIELIPETTSKPPSQP